MGDFKGSLEQQYLATAMAEGVYGGKSFVTAMGHRKIGELHRVRRDFAEAIAEHRRALAVFKHRLPPDHACIVQQCKDIGSAQLSKRELDWALASFRKALELQEATLGKEHYALGDIVGPVASALHLQGRNDEALVEYRRSIELMESSPPHHVTKMAIVKTKQNVAILLSQMGDVDESIRILLEIQPDISDTFGRRSREAGLIFYDLSQMCKKKGDLVAARREMEAAKLLFVDTLGEQDGATTTISKELDELA